MAEVRTNGAKLCKHLVTEVTEQHFRVLQKEAAQTSGGISVGLRFVHGKRRKP
jgi:hypothetical protein